MPIVNRSRGVRALAALGGGGVVAAGLVVAAVPAQAAALSCGTVIRASVTLTANVNCATNPDDDAITIGASGITINLNGHKILGPGDANITVGIGDSGYHNVTIESGTIANFYAGMNVNGQSGNLVTGLRIKNVTITENTLGDEDYGVFANFMRGANMTGLTIKNANYGVYLVDSEHNTLTDSTLASPITGIWDQRGTGNTWSHDTMSNVNYTGIWEYGSTGASITANTIHGIGATGIYDEESVSCSITGNTLTGLYTGIDTDYDKSTTVRANIGSGDAYGMYTDAALDGTYIGNVFSGDQYGFQDNNPYDDTLKSNTTDGNAEAGIWITASGVLNSFAATLVGNTADKNQFGMYSEIHTKGTGNHAVGNTVVNCRNVSCVK